MGVAGGGARTPTDRGHKAWERRGQQRRTLTRDMGLYTNRRPGNHFLSKKKKGKLKEGTDQGAKHRGGVTTTRRRDANVESVERTLKIKTEGSRQRQVTEKTN